VFMTLTADPLDAPPALTSAPNPADGPPVPFPNPAPDGLYAEQALALLPTGPAWPKEPGSVLHKLVSGLSDRFLAVHRRACDLLREMAPISTVELLPDWERVLGLPDDCASVPVTLNERRGAVLQRWRAMGGQSRAYFVEVARALGFDILVEEFRPFQIGTGRAGDAIDGLLWRFAWRVLGPETTQRFFRASEGGAGEPLSVFGNEILECVIGRLKPAHTIVHFAYVPLVDGLSPLLWIDLAQSAVTVTNGVVSRIDSLYGAPSDLVPQSDALATIASEGPDDRNILALSSETDLAYAFDPPLPTLSAGFALAMLVKGGPADARAALGSAYDRLGLILSPREATVGEGASRVTLADPTADPAAWRLVMLISSVEGSMRRLTLRRDGAVIAETLAPLGALDTMAILAERMAVLGLLTIPPDPERAGFIERRIARNWNIKLAGD
jgi:uncharacterized protein YmfQ (DUF2313 family)